MITRAWSGETPRPHLEFRNRQRVRSLNLRLLKRITLDLLRNLPRRPLYDLVFYFVDALEMTRINETHLRHAGSTDVITFDYNDESEPGWLRGEIFICVDECIAHAARFRSTWQSELVRYVIHGVLHLSGYDDLKTADRVKMKHMENAVLRRLADRFALSQVKR